MRNPFQASSEKLPPSDPHDELVRTVDARCAQLREKCWKMRYIVKHYGDVRREYETSVADGHPGDLDEVMVAFRDCSSMEREIINLREQIERAVEDYNFGREISKRIYLSHTEEGLPIRVSKAKKIPIWGI